MNGSYVTVAAGWPCINYFRLLPQGYVWWIHVYASLTLTVVLISRHQGLLDVVILVQLVEKFPVVHGARKGSFQCHKCVAGSCSKPSVQPVLSRTVSFKIFLPPTPRSSSWFSRDLKRTAVHYSPIPSFPLLIVSRYFYFCFRHSSHIKSNSLAVLPSVCTSVDFRMAKRSAVTELNHDNWNEEETPEEAGTFCKAAPDVMQCRVIKSAKRRSTGQENVSTKFTVICDDIYVRNQVLWNMMLCC